MTRNDPREKMMKVKIEGIGPVVFEHSRRARYLNIYVRPLSGVRVAVPNKVSFREALKMFLLKKRWVQGTITKMNTFMQKHGEILKQAERLNRTEAKRKLVGRLEELSGLHGFKFNKIFIRNQKTRWGSCSSKNNISLNVKLSLLPEELIDYVILHELVHTKHKNHKKTFWTELSGLVPEAKEKRARLQKYRLGY